MIKKNIRDSFGKRADYYDLHGIIQKKLAQILFDHIAKQVGKHPVSSILEIGCGTGFLSEHIVRYFKAATHVISDLSTDMVIKCRGNLCDIPPLSSSSRMRGSRTNKNPSKRSIGTTAGNCLFLDPRIREEDGVGGSSPMYLVCDGENLPFSTEFRADLVMASMSLHWFQDFESSLRNLFDITTNLLAFSVPVLGTFKAWTIAHEKLGIKNRMMQFHSVHELERVLSNLKPKNFSIKTIQLSHKLPSAIEVLSHLKSIGASPNINSGHYTVVELRALCKEVDRASNDIANYEIATCIVGK